MATALVGQMDGQCLSVHKIHKKFVPICFLYLIMPKFLVPQLKYRFAPSPRLHPQSDHIIHTHTHTHTQNFTYGFVLAPLQFQSTGQNTHLTSKTVILAMLAFKKNSTHLHSNQPKLSPVSESSTHPLQNYVWFFPLTSRPGSYAHKPTPCHCP